MTEQVIENVEVESSEDSNVAYVVHPCSPELKAELRKKGLKIIDAAFAPEGAKIINGSPKVKGAK